MFNAIILQLVTVPGWYLFLHITFALLFVGLINRKKEVFARVLTLSKALLLFGVSFYLASNCFSFAVPKDDCFKKKARSASDYEAAEYFCGRVVDSSFRSTCRRNAMIKYIAQDPVPFLEKMLARCGSLPFDDNKSNAKERCYRELFDLAHGFGVYSPYKHEFPENSGSFRTRNGPYFFSVVCTWPRPTMNKEQEDKLTRCVEGSLRVKDDSDYLEFCSALVDVSKKNCYTWILSRNRGDNRFYSGRFRELCEEKTGIALKSIYTDRKREMAYNACLMELAGIGLSVSETKQ